MARFEHSKERRRESRDSYSKRDNRGRRDSGRSNGRSSNRFGGRSFDRPERTKVTCSSCGEKCEVPFKPTSSKPVYCDDCFKKDSSRKGSKSNGKEFIEINEKLDKIMKALKID